jgi:N,N-dimethylformamidase
LKSVLAYSDPWSACPGDEVKLHVSLLEGEIYELDLVRVISGDAHGLGLDLRPIDCGLQGAYKGAKATTRLGSSLLIDKGPPLSTATGFEFDLWLWPTTPHAGRQAIICATDVEGKPLFSLEIDDQACLRWKFGNESDHLRSIQPLAQRKWTHIKAGFDPKHKSVYLRQYTKSEPLSETAQWFQTDIKSELSLDVASMRLSFAAPLTPNDTVKPYNGKIAAPCLKVGAQTLAEWAMLGDPATNLVVDKTGGFDGILINLPARAVTGPDWEGDVHDWRFSPQTYNAIHFHADDLYDALWPVSHRFTVPEDLMSGYYAFRLKAGSDTSYSPLFVRPRSGTARAPLAFLASTLTTLAYGNYHFHLHADINEASLGRVGVLSREDIHLCESDELGLATYDYHADGSPVRYGSRLRPIVNNWPGGEVWNLNADTHLLAWLDKTGQAYDLITDEDLHAEGVSVLAPYKCIMVGSHPEYWTSPMMEGLESYLKSGGHFMYLGGNGFYWRTAKSAHWPAAVEVRHAESGGRYTAEWAGHYHMAFTGELGGLWRRSGRPAHALIGVGTVGIGFDGIGHFRRTAASYDQGVNWLFDGIKGETFGAQGLLGSAAGSEIDATNFALGTPQNAIVVAKSEGHSLTMQPMPEEISMPHAAMSAHYDPNICADITYFTTASGGAVLSTSSLSWPAAVAFNGFDNDTARLTANALRRFLGG